MILIININFFDNSFSQTYEINPDSLKTVKDTTETFNLPRFYTNSNLLVGTEIIDPFEPAEFFTRATQLWKTDVRLGMAFNFTKDIEGFIAVRDNDSPRTNTIHLYDAGAKICHDWGTLIFGQRRIQSGNLGYYLNQEFGRPYWNRGLIYDFTMRGVITSINFNQSQLEMFLGTEISSSFLGGIGYGIEILPGWKTKGSAVYIARDPLYSAFGVQFGIESEEFNEYFYGYQVIALKVFDQEPASFQEVTLFAEGRFRPDEFWDLGVAGLFRRLMNIGPNRDELRLSFDINHKISKTVAPLFQTEIFKLADFSEFQFGIGAYLNYIEGLLITPRIRYIFTEFGPDIAYFGLETKIIFGEWE